MFYYTTGDLLKSDAECLVNTVNCEGYMGKGIAHQFKLAYPTNNESYVKACKSGELRIGRIHSIVEKNKIIVNFPTKDKWRAQSKMEYVTSGMDSLVDFIVEKKIKSIAIPPLGSGNGGLVWSEVKPIIEEKLASVSSYIDIYIYEPSVNYQTQPTAEPKIFLSALILMQIKFHLKKFGKIRLQKTAYIVDVISGQKYFKFKRDKYGPYDHSIEIVSKNIKEFQQFHNVQTHDAYNIAYNRLTSDSVNKKLGIFIPYVDKVSKLINLLTENDVECLATMMFLIEEQNVLDVDGIIKGFQLWSEEKAKKFSKTDILHSIDIAEQNGLIENTLSGYIIRQQ